MKETQHNTPVIKKPTSLPRQRTKPASVSHKHVAIPLEGMAAYQSNPPTLGSRPKVIFVFVLLSLILAIRFHISLQTPSQKLQGWNDASSLKKTSSSIARTFKLPIDHFNHTNTRTFKNRYWMNDTFYRQGGPIFLYDGGEAGLSDRGVTQMFSGDIVFAPTELARIFHGIVIIWEHRFFGESMPFEVNETTGYVNSGYDAYKYLINEQALEDLVVFARNFQPEGYALSPKSSPWIAIGGSYAGVRAAMLRVRNPELFFASWSSSAPVQTRVENPNYYNTIIHSMPKNCSADFHAAVSYADETLEYGTEKEVALLKRALFLTNNATVGSSQDMVNAPGDRESGNLTYFNAATILATAFHTFPTFQSLGYRVLDTFCNRLETWNPENATKFTLDSPLSALEDNSFDSPPSRDGIQARHSAESAFYAFIAATITSSKPSLNTPPRQIGSRSDRVSWNWMLCNQFAQFQISQYPSRTNIISRYYNITSFLDNFCYRNFPNLPVRPKVEEVLKYGGWDMKPSNVIFTNGDMDSWRALSIQSSRDIQPDALNRKTTQIVPVCNVPPPGDDVYGIVYPGVVHVSDMRRRRIDPASNVDKGLELFTKALDFWLPCYQTDQS